MAVPYREALKEIAPFAPARSLESARREFNISKFIKLSGNENNHGVSEKAIAALRNFEPELARYPDPYCTILRERLAERLNVEKEQLLFGNGSFELISLTALTYLNPGDEAVIPSPSFGWYKTSVTQAGGVPVTVPLKSHRIDLDALLEAVTPKTRLVCLVNPNNPTGTYFTRSEFEPFLEKLPSDKLVVLDEAYVDFVDGDDFPDGIDFARYHDNVVSLRTFSKVYSLASARIGYAYGHPSIIDALSREKLPINVNGAAQAAAVGALSDQEHYDYVVSANAAGRKLYYETLGRWKIECIPTHCNFIMFNTLRDSAEIELEYLKRGVLVRKGTEFGMPTWLRVTIGTEEENKKALAILGEILGLS
ncbi:MAG: histidinol-phosphate transaminase [Clostridiales bacterium]|jgi:histidinol-phosphate aminotransferase|nr:histidinol-phosphate transaminase [Clostridiales bacterium]